MNTFFKVVLFKIVLTICVLSLMSAIAITLFDFETHKLVHVVLALFVTVFVSAAIGACGLIWGAME